jgi:hypothetical protein
MKNPLKIAKTLGLLFMVAETLTVVAAVIILLVELVSFIAPEGTGPTYVVAAFPSLELKFTEPAISLHSENSAPGDIKVKKFSGRLEINRRSADTRLVARARWLAIPVRLLLLAYAFCLFTFLKQLCANMEGGTIFSDLNFNLIRKIGVVLVLGDVVGNALVAASHYVLGSYLSQHATVTGVKAKLSFNPATDIQFEGIITGLVVFLVAEAFRQGLALKQENELTV